MENLTTKANKGNIFKFEKKNSIGKYVLIVSDDYRCMDNYLSILMLTEYPLGKDVVELDTKFGKKYVHCEMITYCKSGQIGEFVGTISKDEQNNVDNLMARGLGINREVKEELNFYKNAYNKLLDSVSNK